MCYNYIYRERPAAECHRRLPYVGMGPAVWAQVHSGLSLFFTQAFFYFPHGRRQLEAPPP
jgi:hypothetical protein